MRRKRRLQAIVTNGGSDPLAASIEIDYGTGPSGWLTVSPITIECAPGQDLVCALAADRDNLPVGQWSADLTIMPSSSQVAAGKTVRVGVVVPPKLTINTSATSGQAPLSVDFTAMDGRKVATNLPAGSTLTWDFGDSTPVATGNPVSHTFASGGTYTVALTLMLASSLSPISCSQTTEQVSNAPSGGSSGALQVSSAVNDLTASGPQAGPFNPSSLSLHPDQHRRGLFQLDGKQDHGLGDALQHQRGSG